MNIEIPSAELHSRFYANGLTRYSLEEITSAAKEYAACEQEYDELVAQAAPIIGDHDKFPGLIWYAPEPIQALYKQLDSGLIPGYCSYGAKSSKERYPVSTWRKEIKSYRTLIRKVRKALDACTMIAI